ncbi:MAG: single-stranded-DNA-specific exonuclease RecJ [Oscillospiraceae bacterium]|nr:single-stranded-DNA-specific exonuclease RecJ [Oscillospiraceae bacterium]
MKNKDWKIPYARPCVPHELSEAGYPPLLSQVLALRGIKTADEAELLLRGGEEELFDPLLMLDMDKAKERILRAIEKGEIVSVYGDYDVDGITSTCLVTDYLRSKGIECHPYIPDRSDEGYGLNMAALKNLREKGVSLVITVDCGITAVEEAEYAKSLGIDMVITDHHECKPDSLPKVSALIDCKREGDTYPNKDLSGVGVALKLVCACEGSSREMLHRYADLVAIGTIADVMPLVGENRFLVRYGLKRIVEAPRPGIAAMLKESSVDIKKLNASTVGFSLAPRLNAAGRLGQTVTAAKLIMSEDEASASALAHELCELNRKRQSIELEIWKEANELMRSHKPDGPIVLASDKWHQGVIGIAASRLAEQYSMPAIIICLNGDIGKGSCRSHGGFNLFEALSACSEHLLGFGGHALAAGLNIHRDKLDDFRQALKDYYYSNKPQPVAEVQCDLLITEPAMLSIENVRSLDLLEPYGNANHKPVLCLSGVRVDALNEVGGGRHLRMRIRLGGSAFECIYFSHNAADCGISEGDIIDLAFSPQINEFRGNISVQLVVSAVRLHDPSALCAMILEGDESAEWAASGYCPNRADFVKLWRSMPQNFTVGKDTGEILSQCLCGMEPEKYCLCLMVLRETGLLSSASGDIFCAKCAQISGKADLEATRLIKSLRSFR